MADTFYIPESSHTYTSDEILRTAIEAGIIILKNGGETYRSEEIMYSAATLLGAENVSAFVTPTVVMLTCTDKNGKSCVHFKRIINRTINLGKIAKTEEAVKRFSSGNKKPDLRAVHRIFRRIDNAPTYSKSSVVAATALGSFCFSLLFGGTLKEASAAFIIGMIMRILLFSVVPLKLSDFMLSIFGGFLISIMSGAAAYWNLIPSIGNVSISVLMTLVPGLILVNAIRDIIAGDLVAGAAKLLEAFLIAAALSIGAAFGLFPFPPEEVSYVSAIKTWNSLGPAFLCAFFATASFSYFFYLTINDIVPASFLSAAGWTIYLILRLDINLDTTTAFMAGAFCVGTLSEILAALLKKPATLFIIPSIIPFVPGGGIYETMLYSIWGNMDLAAVTGFKTLTAAGAIAAGVALASSLSHAGGRIKKLCREKKR